jgi:YidC/Oxa1 family membrane protein insertase
MSTDPQRDAQLKRQRIMMLLLMIPWFILMYMWTKNAQNSQQLEQQEALLEAEGGDGIDTTAPVDDQIRALRARIEADPKAEKADFDRLKIAVLLEQDAASEADFRKAAEEYEKFAKEQKGSPYAAHATYHAARIYKGYLDDEKRFKKLLGGITFDYNRAIWDHENVGNRNDKHPAAVIAGEELDPYNQHDVRYKFLAFLVGLFDPESHPDYAYAAGVMLLGFMVKVLVWPLTGWSSRASKTMGAKMKMIQPLIAELKEKHKDDQLKVMREQQELMRKYDVSMKSGCLPMIISMAILIPVYQAVRLYAYPLQQGEFLWIGNLARPDMILLVIYVGAFFLSTKLQPQPASADPQQQQTQKMMMMIMPIMFFFFMQSVASGFILYWTVFLIFSTVQSLWLNYQWERAGGDQAIIDAMPEELRVKPKRPSRKELEKSEKADGKGDGKTDGKPEKDSGAVERLGEEIDVEPERPKGFLERLLAPALEQAQQQAEAAKADQEAEGESVDVGEDEDSQAELDEAADADSNGDGRRSERDERRARRKEKRRQARQSKAKTS